MCFSATASLTAGIGLSFIGYALLRKVHSKKEILVAIIPLFFAFQQLTEAIIWLTLDIPYFLSLKIAMTYIFLFFAFSVWPIASPLSIYLIETGSLRKKILLLLMVLGSLLSAYLLVSLLVNGVTISEFHGNIFYACRLEHTPNYIYLFITTIPFLISNKKYMIYFGIATFVAFWIAAYFYSTVFISTWCFFAAILSGILYFSFPSIPLKKKI